MSRHAERGALKPILDAYGAHVQPEWLELPQAQALRKGLIEKVQAGRMWKEADAKGVLGKEDIYTQFLLIPSGLGGGLKHRLAPEFHGSKPDDVQMGEIVARVLSGAEGVNPSVQEKIQEGMDVLIMNVMSVAMQRQKAKRGADKFQEPITFMDVDEDTLRETLQDMSIVLKLETSDNYEGGIWHLEKVYLEVHFAQKPEATQE